MRLPLCMRHQDVHGTLGGLARKRRPSYSLLQIALGFQNILKNLKNPSNKVLNTISGFLHDPRKVGEHWILDLEKVILALIFCFNECHLFLTLKLAEVERFGI